MEIDIDRLIAEFTGTDPNPQPDPESPKLWDRTNPEQVAEVDQIFTDAQQLIQAMIMPIEIVRLTADALGMLAKSSGVPDELRAKVRRDWIGLTVALYLREVAGVRLAHV